MSRLARGIVLMTIVALSADARGGPIARLSGTYRQGQVLLKWQEQPVPDGTTFNVYTHPQPITQENLSQATRIAHHVHPQSARDWWLNPETYGRPIKNDPQTATKPSYPIRGFIVEEGGRPLDANDGLHVHTVRGDEQGPRYYAVISVLNGKEDTTVVAGENALLQPVEQRCEPVRPIWQGPKGKALRDKAGKGKALWLWLHSKGSRRTTQYLAFGDDTLGWREGLPFKFDVDVQKDFVMILPCDRIWAGRIVEEAKAAGNRLTPAIHQWWYGCSDKIYDAKLVPTGTPTNYAERRLMWILQWAKDCLKIDPTRVYCTGSSMGGCGTISFALHHPEIFAAIAAQVPSVAYDEGDPSRGERDDTGRLTGFCGPLDLVCSDGMRLRDRLDARLFVRSHPLDLPFTVVINGRRDHSIRWRHNPDFYRAMEQGRHGFIAAWNNGAHSTAEAKMPKDIRRWSTFGALSRFALNRSYPAFSRCSADGDPGHGDPQDGDLVGFMNRGLDWQDPIDQADRYEVQITWTAEPDKLPVTVDVTPRRIQAFRLQPGQRVKAVNLDHRGEPIQQAAIEADRYGLATFQGFELTSPAGNRLVLTRE